MKIDIRLEDDGTPILFFPDDTHSEKTKTITCYSRIGQHSEASRAYMRSCKKPTTSADVSACMGLLAEWASMP